ncbi:TlpA family protein disulfide reductase [Lutibacter holmesii]|uniref:TlpA family protein disulfide reductase n=1 Tax=Lutibacter holmesii TaxID=1137985 RepID=A0ABW3WPB0_9FLAO
MRNSIWVFVAVILFSSCTSEVKDYSAIKGKVNVEDITSILIQGKGYTKEIAVNEDGTFSDTLKAPEGMYGLIAGVDRATLYLKNGYDLNLELVAGEAENTVLFTGEGAETNNYLKEKAAFFMSDYANPKSYFKLEKAAYELRLSEAKAKFNESAVDISKVDSSVIEIVGQSDKQLFAYVESNYEQNHASLAMLGAGKPSPVFSNYENFAGGTTSLSDLKGKFVYIDIWATWCGPCKREIPSLKLLEEEYHGKNIEFVSISVDNIDGKRGSHESWLKMVKDEELGGTQLFADNDFNSEFIRAYNINSIPRFILIDPKGNIVDADVLRPSNPKLKDYFTELGI